MLYSSIIYYFGNSVYILVYIIVVFCSVAVFIKLRNQINMSKATIMTNLQLSIIMIIQAVIPIIVQFGPTAFFSILNNYFQIKAILMAFPISILFAFMGPTYALCVMIIIKNFRKRIFKLIFKKFGGGNFAKTSFVNVSQNQMLNTNNTVAVIKI